MADLPRLTIADQALANLVIALATSRGTDVARERWWLTELADLIPRATRDHPWFESMVEAAETLLVAHDAGWRGSPRTWACYEASAAAEQFAEWRAVMALDALKRKKRNAA